ncbi:hypothetical protein RRSL_02515 [Ralstonia solanacearum UW551]|uniref:Uncharacterized protein n=1 Tax=Ralstonia solanacearum (strain UW551) TaxID=342110 RepID=A0AB33VEL1_RALSU|nr:hypothetical protein RRSL_02515 [Ralstonia solanacearum UW551]
MLTGRTTSPFAATQRRLHHGGFSHAWMERMGRGDRAARLAMPKRRGRYAGRHDGTDLAVRRTASRDCVRCGMCSEEGPKGHGRGCGHGQHGLTVHGVDLQHLDLHRLPLV